LWALAAHDMDAARLMKTYYQQYVDELSKLVRNMRPILSKSRADRAAVLIASLIEGASLFRGFQKSVGPASRNMESDIKTIVVQIIENI
ncbi:MAG: TetR family transcriptional regulator C-terminal domain-containing protein, partial [Parasphingorhabdus sp.]